MDNGIPSSVGRVNFRVTSHLAARVGSINLKWNDDWTPAREGDRFRHAMKTAAYDFIDVAFEVVRSWLPARQLVLSMMQSHKDNIGFLPVPCPWKRHLNSLEAQHPELAGAVRFVVFQNDPKDTWYVQSVPDESDDGQARKSRMRIRFPPHTRGLSDAALCKAIGLEDCRFVHASGHIGASKTLEGAYAMARVALKENWTS
ncbi:metal-dependent protein hydrolase [Tribonema minus]|uniref:Metal-dependent protein hydrolase n=1 Tax=Tribonema minus TaxID=303371 RepID=A0A835ZF87_9STRA|nr:metal-dependent protein hydrolase [Tribonema minus]